MIYMAVFAQAVYPALHDKYNFAVYKKSYVMQNAPEHVDITVLEGISFFARWCMSVKPVFPISFFFFFFFL